MDTQNSESQDVNWTFSKEENSPAPKTTKVEPIQWSAAEYITHEKSPEWYTKMAVAGGLLVGFIFIVTRDWFASLVVVLALALLAVFASRAPGTRNYTLNDNGLEIDGKLYAYKDFRSFSVVEEGVIDSIWLKPIKRFQPMVVIYFAPTDEASIVELLANFLPNEPRELDMIDQISKRAKF